MEHLPGEQRHVCPDGRAHLQRRVDGDRPQDPRLRPLSSLRTRSRGRNSRINRLQVIFVQVIWSFHSVVFLRQKIQSRPRLALLRLQQLPAGFPAPIRGCTCRQQKGMRRLLPGWILRWGRGTRQSLQNDAEFPGNQDTRLHAFFFSNTNSAQHTNTAHNVLFLSFEVHALLVSCQKCREEGVFCFQMLRSPVRLVCFPSKLVKLQGKVSNKFESPPAK